MREKKKKIKEENRNIKNRKKKIIFNKENSILAKNYFLEDCWIVLAIFISTRESYRIILQHFLGLGLKNLCLSAIEKIN